MGLLTKGAVLAALIAAWFGLWFVMTDGGIRRHWPEPKFAFSEIPSLKGKVAIVTGSNTGIGYTSAVELVRKGCKVYVAARSASKQEETKKKIVSELGAGSGDLVKTLSAGLSLDSFESIDAYATAFKKAENRLDILLLNAGVMTTPFKLIHGGRVEQQFGINHLGHFYLTMKLMDILEKSQPSRVVSVSSAGHWMAGSIPFDKLGDKDSYDPARAYAVSKLSNILFARELARRVKGKKIYVNACHPGFVQTELGRHVEDFASQFVSEEITKMVSNAFLSFALTAKEGAVTQLYLATSPEVEQKNISGEYFVPQARMKDTSWDYTLSFPASKVSTDMTLAKKLWDFSVEFTGLDYKP